MSCAHDTDQHRAHHRHSDRRRADRNVVASRAPSQRARTPADAMGISRSTDLDRPTTTWAGASADARGNRHADRGHNDPASGPGGVAGPGNPAVRRRVFGHACIHAAPPTPRSRCHVHLVCSDLNVWSGRRDSNPRPQPWQGCALPLSYARSGDLGTVRLARPSGAGRASNRVWGEGQGVCLSLAPAAASGRGGGLERRRRCPIWRARHQRHEHSDRGRNRWRLSA